MTVALLCAVLLACGTIAHSERPPGTVDTLSGLEEALASPDVHTIVIADGSDFSLQRPLLIERDVKLVVGAEGSASLHCTQTCSTAIQVAAAKVHFAGLRIDGCASVAVEFLPQQAASAPVDWAFTRCAFYDNTGVQASDTAPDGGMYFAASAVSVPSLRGSLSLDRCTFQGNGAPQAGPHATPVLGVACEPPSASGAAPCAISITGGSFSNNSGALASALLMQTFGAAEVQLTGVQFVGNAGFGLSPAGRIGGTPFELPAAAAIHVVRSSEPSRVSTSLDGVSFRGSIGSHGYMHLQVPEENDAASWAQLNITSSSFTDHASGLAALMVLGAQETTISDCIMSGNAGRAMLGGTRTLSGGASAACVAVAEAPAGAAVTVADSAFDNNTASDSASLYLASYSGLLLRSSDVVAASSATVRGSNFTKHGGALARAAYVLGLDQVEVSGCRFEGNSIGALGVQYASSLVLSNSLILDNLQPQQHDLNGGPLVGPSIGGGLWVTDTGSVTASDTRFERNAAVSGGGAVFQTVDFLTVTNCTWLGNAASGGSGGGVYTTAVATAVFDGCKLAGNEAAGDAGALAALQGGSVTLTGCSFHDNVAGGSGGAVHLSQVQTDGHLIGCAFHNNTARAGSGSGSSGAAGAAAAAADSLLEPSAVGGGAVYCSDLSGVLELASCNLTANTAGGPVSPGGAGAIMVRSSGYMFMYQCLLSDNRASMGGAVHLSNMASDTTSTISQSTFVGNAATAPSLAAAAAANTASKGSGSAVGAVGAALNSSSSGGSGGSSDLADEGLGGALYVETSVVTLACSAFTSNVALLGGAVYARLAARVAIAGEQLLSDICPVLYEAVLPEPGPAAAVAPAAAQRTYVTLFSSNAALTGGAVYVGQGSVLWAHDIPGIPKASTKAPGVVFVNNTAVAGGALLLYAARAAALHADLISNSATPSAASGVIAALGLEAASATAALPAGAGGAIAAIGTEGTVVRLRRCVLSVNNATYGGAVYVSPSEGCSSPNGCFSVQLVESVLTHNTATGAGGGVFWTHPGLLDVACTASAGLGDYPGGATLGAPLLPPPVFPDAVGPVQPQQQGPPDSVEPLDVPPAPDAPIMDPPSPQPPAPGPPIPPQPPSPEPPVPPQPYHRLTPRAALDQQLLPCPSWSSNKGTGDAYGDDVASTPFSLGASPLYQDFYTSSSPLAVVVVVLDYYGQRCSSSNHSVVVRSVSPEIFGQTFMASANGTATFDDLKLRGPAGWHDVDFAATTAFRELSTAGMTIYVRPCAIGEFLTPTLDQCIACSDGYFNFNKTSQLCQPCPSGAFCSDADFPGMVVPTSGSWHSNYYSEQVHSCPNANACDYINRTVILSNLQQRVMGLARAIQASLVVRPAATAPIAAPEPQPAMGAAAHDAALSDAGSSNATGTAHAALRRLQQALGYTPHLDVTGALLPATAVAAHHAETQQLLLQEEEEEQLQGRRERRTLVMMQHAGDSQAAGSPYGEAPDDFNYSILLKTAVELASNYSAALCAVGYRGVLCGACAHGWGSTGPAKCHPCPSFTYNTLYYALAMLLTLAMLAYTIRSLLAQALAVAEESRKLQKSILLAEMRHRGRRDINPALMNALDDDELPDISPPPFFGALPNYLEALRNLRNEFTSTTTTPPSRADPTSAPLTPRSPAAPSFTAGPSGLGLKTPTPSPPPAPQSPLYGAATGGMSPGTFFAAAAAVPQSAQSWSASALQPPAPWSPAGAGKPAAPGAVPHSPSRLSSPSISSHHQLKPPGMGMEQLGQQWRSADGGSQGGKDDEEDCWADARCDDDPRDSAQDRRGGRPALPLPPSVPLPKGEAAGAKGGKEDGKKDAAVATGAGGGSTCGSPFPRSRLQGANSGCCSEAASPRTPAAIFAQADPNHHQQQQHSSQAPPPQQPHPQYLQQLQQQRAGSPRGTAAALHHQQRLVGSGASSLLAMVPRIGSLTASPHTHLQQRLGSLTSGLQPRTGSATGPSHRAPPSPQPQQAVRVSHSGTPLPFLARVALRRTEQLGGASAANSSNLEPQASKRPSLGRSLLGMALTVRTQLSNTLLASGGANSANGGPGQPPSPSPLPVPGSSSRRCSLATLGFEGREVSIYGTDDGTQSGVHPLYLAGGGRGGGSGRGTFQGMTRPKAMLQDAATIKIFITYVQILALVRAVPIPHPPEALMQYMRFYDQLTAVPGSLVSVDCSLPDSPAASKAMQRTVLAALAPLYVSLAVSVFWALLMLANHWRRKAEHRQPLRLYAASYLPSRLLMSFATTMFYFYPNTVTALLSIFSCVDVDDGSTSNALAAKAGLFVGKYWTLDYSERCYHGRHLALVLGLGVGGLLLLAVGWPLCVAVWLYRKSRSPAHVDFSDFSMIVYASYTEVFKLNLLYWESVVMLRQMAVAAVVVLMAQQEVTVQMLVVIAIVTMALVGQLLLQPYRTATTNRLEQTSLVVISITLYLNLYYLSPDVVPAARTFLGALIITINAAMLAVFVYHITTANWEAQLDKFGLDKDSVLQMPAHHIYENLRAMYGPATATFLTRVLQSARTVDTVKRSLYQQSSTLSRRLGTSISRRIGGFGTWKSSGRSGKSAVLIGGGGGGVLVGGGGAGGGGGGYSPLPSGSAPRVSSGATFFNGLASISPARSYSSPRGWGAEQAGAVPSCAVVSADYVVARVHPLGNGADGGGGGYGAAPGQQPYGGSAAWPGSGAMSEVPFTAAGGALHGANGSSGRPLVGVAVGLGSSSSSGSSERSPAAGGSASGGTLLQRRASLRNSQVLELALQ